MFPAYTHKKFTFRKFQVFLLKSQHFPQCFFEFSLGNPIILQTTVSRLGTTIVYKPCCFISSLTASLFFFSRVLNKDKQKDVVFTSSFFQPSDSTTCLQFPVASADCHCLLCVPLFLSFSTVSSLTLQNEKGKSEIRFPPFRARRYRLFIL